MKLIHIYAPASASSLNAHAVRLPHFSTGTNLVPVLVVDAGTVVVAISDVVGTLMVGSVVFDDPFNSGR